MHLLSHVGDYMRYFGPMPSSSARSMERSIGVLKRTMKASHNVASNNNNILEVGALLDYLDFSGIVDFEIKKKKEDRTFKDHPADPSFPQLWAYFLDFPLSLKHPNKQELIKKTFSISQLGSALFQLLARSKGSRNVKLSFMQQDYKMTVAAKLWKDDQVFYSSLHINTAANTQKEGFYAMFEANRMCRNK